MTYQDALYQRFLLEAGFTDQYAEWLDAYLKEDTPSDDIAYELASLGDDFDRIISALRKYTDGKDADELLLEEKLRLFIRDAYHSRKATLDECMNALFSFTESVGRNVEEEEPWSFLMELSGYYEVGKDVDDENMVKAVKKAFNDYIDNNAKVNIDLLCSGDADNKLVCYLLGYADSYEFNEDEFKGSGRDAKACKKAMKNDINDDADEFVMYYPNRFSLDTVSLIFDIAILIFIPLSGRYENPALLMAVFALFALINGVSQLRKLVKIKVDDKSITKTLFGIDIGQVQWKDIDNICVSTELGGCVRLAFMCDKKVVFKCTSFMIGFLRIANMAKRKNITFSYN